MPASKSNDRVAYDHSRRITEKAARPNEKARAMMPTSRIDARFQPKMPEGARQWPGLAFLNAFATGPVPDWHLHHE